MTGPDSASAAWRLMFDFFMRSAPERSESLRQRGLTPNDARALSGLDGSQGRPIGELARQWKSDPSNTTWVVDRLEKAGLVERRAAPEDRRVKLVALTTKGRRTRDELLAEFRRPPREITALDADDLVALERIFKKISAATPAADDDR
ncbi:MarR family winged helix-turn-helix transcriptional regulator [Mesorhizobium sp. NPDC059025]|uniref:MarR family winged helix-turn-helix transcriptional regulator n=1 Tax=unclassified Mesorhizobium TaxID=325217 RepID=UPI0036875360